MPAKAPEMSAEAKEWLAEVLPPAEAVPVDRDPVSGRFLKGRFKTGGRPRGWGGVYNFRKIARAYVESLGGSIEDIVAQLVEDLRIASRMGDIGATKLLLDRFCGKEAEAVALEVTAAPMSDVERATRLHAILDAAARRAGGEL